MTTSNSIRIFHCDAEDARPLRPRRRKLSPYLVPERRNLDDSKECTEKQQFESTHDSLKRQLAERTLELELARESLVQGNLEFQEFASAVSHDLQAPLRAISGFSMYLHQEYQGKLDDVADGYIDHIVNGATFISQLVQGLTQFSRVTSKAMPFDTVDLNEVFESALSELQELITSVGAVVRSSELPTISGDRIQLVYLMKNIIENGLKFNQSETPTVLVSAENIAKTWVVTVVDNGIGIAKEYLDCVFAIFRRLHTRQKFEGIGAGLAVCRRIVNRHLGQIWLDSQELTGTKVSIRLPETTAPQFNTVENYHDKNTSNSNESFKKATFTASVISMHRQQIEPILI